MKITPWSDKQVVFDDEKHLYLVDGQPKCGPSQLLKMVGLAPDVEQMPEPMRSNFINAGNLGKVVHKWCEIFDNGEYDKYEPPIEKVQRYIDAWVDFKHDYNVEIIEMETPRYSEYGDYCGIPDIVGLVKDDLFIIDRKTSKSINPNGRIQTISYTYFFKEDMKRMIVQLGCDGKFKIYDDGTHGKEFMFSHDKDDWEAVLRVSNLIRKVKNGN